MAHNRNPLHSYRINRRGRRVKVTTSGDRAKRSKVSKVPKPTSSSTRATTKGNAQSRVTTNNSTSTPRKTRYSGGIIGTRQTPATKTTYQGPPKTKQPSINRISKQLNAKPKVKPTKTGMRGNNVLKTLGATALVGALSSGKLRNPVSKAKKAEAAKSIGKYNTKDKDGKVRNRKKVGPKTVGPKIVGPKRVGTMAESFDRAFAAARRSGKKTFTWKGKLYGTKLAGE